MKVAKFGGTSVSDANQLKKVRELLLADTERRIVVVSAPGKRFSGDTKVTDLLIQCARHKLGGRDPREDVHKVIERYQVIAHDLSLPPALCAGFQRDLIARLDATHGHTEKYEDTIKAAGEDYCARLFAAYLKSTGMDAEYVNPKDAGMIVSEEYGQARVLKEAYEHLSALKHHKGIAVFPGFFGYSRDGNIVTFSRGGSDLTGAILAGAVKADVYENFTDVDGISVVDPRIIKNPVLIKELTYKELRELSYGGFSVFHEEAMVPALEHGIPINVRNTNNPSHPGTWVVISRTPVHGALSGIACAHGFCAIFVSKYLMNRETGFGRRLLEIIEDEGISFDHAPSGVDSITIVLRESQLSEAITSRIHDRVINELGADTVTFEYGMALLSLVGEGMRRTVGLASRVTTALAKGGINIEMLIQGPSEMTMIVGLKNDDAANAVRQIYDEFFAK